MKIVFVTEWYVEKMGYAENCLAKALASLNEEVHIITSNVKPYFDSPFFSKVYGDFLGKSVEETGKKKIDGYFVHRLPFLSIGQHFIKGLPLKLKQLKPQVVQTFDCRYLMTAMLGIMSPLLKYKFFTGNHTVASVYPPYYSYSQMNFRERMRIRLFHTLPGKVASLFTTKSFPATVDAAHIAEKFFGVSAKKITVDPLGVDTDFFHPFSNDTEEAKRFELRKSWGVNKSEILCVYTGRFTEEKNPLCLAKAVERLYLQGKPFKAVFFGEGPQKEEILAAKGCQVRPFVPFSKLSEVFWAADVGIWPRQESISMIDASACALPIIISDRVLAKERVEGNGLTYRENDVESLISQLLCMQDESLRKRLGKFGSEKIQNKFSWKAIAKRRLSEYYDSVSK
ncbi:MAG: glycosyltransferase family 4 protein [Candidatus Riflebacteria bacterium]|nr:glycosyltransferase family 4 protein [Candidatus Riflebacteria bacterium]